MYIAQRIDTNAILALHSSLLLVVLLREKDEVVSHSHGARLETVAVLANIFGVARPFATPTECDDVARIWGVHSFTIIWRRNYGS